MFGSTLELHYVTYAHTKFEVATCVYNCLGEDASIQENTLVDL